MDNIKQIIRDFIREQEEEIKEPEETTGEDTQEEPTDYNVPGMESPESKYTESYIGKMYEMKKIHIRLLSLMSFLEQASNKSLIKLRAFVIEALELFTIVTNNIDTYKDKLGEIIVTFYKFLSLAFSMVQAYYEKENRDNNQDFKEEK